MSRDFYDIIADHYDIFQSDIDPKVWAGRIDSLVSEFRTSDGEGEGGRPILVDLGCGSGSITLAIKDLGGYEIIGIDRSQRMLGIARQKAPDELWLCQDITSYELYGAADVFIATLDTVNHITDEKALRRLFLSFRDYMAPGGLFIFDAASRKHLEETLGDNVFYEDYDKFTLLWDNHFSGDVSTSGMTLFYGEDGVNYKRADAVVKERYYGRDFFGECAAEAGLESVYEETTGDGEREIYVFRKKR